MFEHRRRATDPRRLIGLGAIVLLGLLAAAPFAGASLTGSGSSSGPTPPSPATSAARAGAGTIGAGAPPTGGRATPAAASSAPGSPDGYLVSAQVIRERAQLAAHGVEPYANALDELLVFADLAIRAAPTPQQPLDVRGTGGPFVDDTAAAYGLALAAIATGSTAYAAHARDIVMAWVEVTTVMRNTCPSDGRCQTSLVVSRAAPGFVFAVDLLATSGAFSTADIRAFRSWLAEVVLPAASERANNWGDAGTFMRLVVTDYLGDRPGFSAAVASWRASMDLVASDGHIPEETRRGRDGIMYTQEALGYKIASARVAERRGVSLWDYVGYRGATLREAIDYLAGYQAHPSRWPWSTLAVVPRPGPLWELAYEHWRDPICVRYLEIGRPLGSEGHSALRWTTFTNGVELPSTASPAPAP